MCRKDYIILCTNDQLFCLWFCRRIYTFLNHYKLILFYTLTGTGWAHWLIGGVYAPASGTACDIASKCDPYVKVQIGEESLSTTPKDDSAGYVSIEQMLHSKEVKNTTHYTISFMDKDGDIKWDDDDKVATDTAAVANLQKSHTTYFNVKGQKFAVFYLGYWTNKYTLS